MRKIYESGAARQRAYRKRKVEKGYKKFTLYVPADVAEEIAGEPQKLIEAYTELKESKRKKEKVKT